MLITLRKRFTLVFDRWANQMGLELIELLQDESQDKEKIMIVSKPHSFADEMGVHEFIKDLKK